MDDTNSLYEYEEDGSSDEIGSEPSNIKNFNFKGLPVELQSKILRSENSLKNVSSFINRPIKEASAVSYMHDECYYPIVRNEFDRYIQNYRPLLTCEFFFSRNKEYWCYIGRIRQRLYWDVSDINYLYIILFLTNNGNDPWFTDIRLGEFTNHLARAIFQAMDITPETAPIEYDLMTMYYIFKERQSCMNFDSNYAKRRVIEIFEENEVILSHEGQLVSFRANAMIMGIQTKGFKPFYSGEYDPIGASDDIIMEVEFLKNEIRKRLEAL